MTRQPTWPPLDDRPRVLVEGSSGHALAGRPCPLAGGADATLIDRSSEQEQARLGAAHRELHPGVPVCVTADGDVDTIELVERLARAHAVGEVSGGDL